MSRDVSNQRIPEDRSPLTFFLLVLALSLPFYLLGALTPFQILPGLPLSVLIFLCPGTAAAILIYREKGSPGIKELLLNALDLTRIKKKIWYIPTILLMPVIMLLSYLVMIWMGTPLPAPQFSPLSILLLSVMFFISGLGEELGWSGYITDPLQKRIGMLGGSLLLGVVWSVWHYIPLLEANRSLSFILWWSLDTIATRIIIVWLYNHTGHSVLIATIFHAMVNLTWQLFPINGSYYDPRVTGLITAIVAILIVIANPTEWFKKHA